MSLVPAEGPGEGSTANNTGSGTSDDDITVSSEDSVNTMKAPQSQDEQVAEQEGGHKS